MQYVPVPSPNMRALKVNPVEWLAGARPCGVERGRDGGREYSLFFQCVCVYIGWAGEEEERGGGLGISCYGDVKLCF